MMITDKLGKLFRNILNARAISVLGLGGYSWYLASFVWSLPEIFRSGDLRPLDRSMSERVKTFRYRGTDIRYDCPFADSKIKDGSFMFGLIREILIRDCYFLYLPENTFPDLKVVVDLGANRGVFSTLCSAVAQHILSVEALPEFKPVIEHQARLNGHENIIAVETAFVGSGGEQGLEGQPTVSLSSLLTKHGMESIDLMKIDIEGSEYSLFKQTDWLPRVKRICMEVHNQFGNAWELVDCLREHGFSVITADSNLRQVSSTDQTFDFLYAWR